MAGCRAVDLEGQFAYKVQFTDEHFAAFTGRDVSSAAPVTADGEILVEDSDPLLDTEVKKGWSNGTDNRALRSEAAGFPEGHIPFKSIGWLTVGGTGTFIGRKMVLTVAHAVLSVRNGGEQNTWTPTGAAYNWDLVNAPPTYTNRTYAMANDFYPRLDQNTVAASWATVRALFYLTPLEYSDGTCTDLFNCVRYDFALILTSGPNPAGTVAGGTNAHPGYVGFYSGQSLAWHQANPTYMRGYPSCGTSDNWTRASRPGGWNSTTCQHNTLYGDTTMCDVGSGLNLINGSFAELTIDCDGSPGMSGSMFYVWNSGTNAAHAVGVYSFESCAGNPGYTGAPSCAGVTHPGHMTALTADRGDLLSVYRSTSWNNWP